MNEWYEYDTHIITTIQKKRKSFPQTHIIQSNVVFSFSQLRIEWDISSITCFGEYSISIYMKCGYSKFYNNSIKEKSINFNSINNRTFNLNINKFLFSRMNKKKKDENCGWKLSNKTILFQSCSTLFNRFSFKNVEKKKRKHNFK